MSTRMSVSSRCNCCVNAISDSFVASSFATRASSLRICFFARCSPPLLLAVVLLVVDVDSRLLCVTIVVGTKENRR